MGPWTNLCLAGVLEVAWAVGLKYSHGFTRIPPSILTVGAMVGSLYFLSQPLKHIPVGTGYAVWTGIGTIGTVVLGIILFSESASPSRVLCIAAIVAGIVGLRLT